MLGESCYVNPEAKGHYEGCRETYTGIKESLQDVLSRHALPDTTGKNEGGSDYEL